MSYASDGTCPNCGSPLADEAVACPECGSCEETGWSERARYDSIGVDYDENEFDYDEFVEREFEGGRKGSRRQMVVAAIAIALIIAFLAAFL